MTEMKRCPFCEGEPDLDVGYSVVSETAHAHICCKGCYVMMVASCSYSDEAVEQAEKEHALRDQSLRQTLEDLAIKKVLDKWNRRSGCATEYLRIDL